MTEVKEISDNYSVSQKFKRIQQLLKIKSVSAFASEIGIDTSVLTNIMSPSGRQSKPSFDTLQKLAVKFPRVNIEWIVTGKGEPLRPFGYAQQTAATNFEAGETDSTLLGNNSQTVYHRDFVKKQPETNPELRAALKVCQAEKENLEKIIALKDEMLAMLKSRSGQR